MGRTAETAPLWGDRAFVSPETYDALVALIARLEAVILAETAALERHDHAGLADATRQKRQGLLELARLTRAMANTVPSQDILARLAAFRTRLAANEAALRVALRAAQDVGAIIVRALREAESDGTYSRAHGRSDFGQPGPQGYGWE